MEKNTPERFNVRVYGIWLDRERILLSRELYGEKEMLKFPGGGLEFGEGLEAGLRREFREELNMEIELGELLYINEFLQVSAFNAQDQLLSVYYRVYGDLQRLPALNDARGYGVFWKNLHELDAEELTFPIDRAVMRKIIL